MNSPQISVVVATFERPESLRRLLGDLALQSLAPESFEVLVVDDGSTLPAIAAVADAVMPAATRFLRIPNSGPGAARDAGARQARGAVLVFVDDDMQLGPDFLSAHLRAHATGGAGIVVLGNIQPAAELRAMPLFERFHARQLARFQEDGRSGRLALRGVHLCTGNVSLRRADYLAVGGFDVTLRRSEDRDLGIRLEGHGCRFVFGAEAVAVHDSDHRSARMWRRRSVLWGRADVQIATRHPDVSEIHPWRFWSLIDPRARPFVAVATALPTLGGLMAAVTYLLARAADAVGRNEWAMRLTTLTYAFDYFRGLRLEAGSLRAVRGPAAPLPSAGTELPESRWRAFTSAVRADHDQLRVLRRKYHADEVPGDALGGHLVRKVGFQMLAMYRLMRWTHSMRIPLAAPILSRVIRHLYAAEVHWLTRLAPGVALVHGVGLVLSSGAEVGPGCVLFQGVTLGEARDGRTGVVGAPRLEANVHVGPGAVLLGPITIGAGSKIMAGCVVAQDIPAGSVVRPAEVVITLRRVGAAV